MLSFGLQLVLFWLYNRTQESWLLDLGTVVHERTADWTSTIPSWHGVNICQSFREPAQYYQQSQDLKHLEATERNYRQVWGTYGQFPGGMFGAATTLVAESVPGARSVINHLSMRKLLAWAE